MKDDIPVILCKLEKIFPPAFFDIMIHVAIHLPRDVELAGPVQFCWMYPIERCLSKYKQFVRNIARPEGSIAEGYLTVECLTFCSCIFVGLRQNGLVKNGIVTGGRWERVKACLCSLNEFII